MPDKIMKENYSLCEDQVTDNDQIREDIEHHREAK